MAHKHNRRRVRHRTRRGRYEQNLPTLYESSSYDSLSSFSESPRVAVDSMTSPQSRPVSTSSSSLSDAAILRNWLDASASADGWDRSRGHGQGPIMSYPHATRQLWNEEVRAMHIFGGEPGEDVALDGKMQEMFDSMEWMHT